MAAKTVREAQQKRAQDKGTVKETVAKAKAAKQEQQPEPPPAPTNATITRMAFVSLDEVIAFFVAGFKKGDREVLVGHEAIVDPYTRRVAVSLTFEIGD